MLRTLILRLVHHLIAFVELIVGFLKVFPQYNILSSKKCLPAKVQADAKQLRKLPLHIGLIVMENDISYKDLANIVVWSVTMGISYVSIYDVNGEIKRNNMQLQKEIEDSRREMSFDKENTAYEIWIYCHGLYTEQRAIGCGGKKAWVHLLSAEDGQQSLSLVARRLCQQVSAQQTLAKDISSDLVDKLLHDIYSFPDPDLCLKFGSCDSLLGYLPWHVRLTEILFVPSHRELSYPSFFSTMTLYSKSEQRFGK